MRNSAAVDYLDLVASTYLFSGIDACFIRRVLSDPEVRQVEFDKGDIIFSPSHYTRTLGIIVLGQALVSKSDQDPPIVMSVLREGDLFGAATLFNDYESYVTTITAREVCHVIFLSEALLKTLFQESFQMVENYLRYLSQRIRFLNQRIESFSRSGAAQKLMVYLIDNAVNGQVTTNLKWNQLANALGISRASLYRILDQLEADGTIRREGKSIHIIDWHI